MVNTTMALEPFKIGRRELLEHLVVSSNYEQWEIGIERFNFGLTPGIREIEIKELIIGKDKYGDVIKTTLN